MKLWKRNMKIIKNALVLFTILFAQSLYAKKIGRVTKLRGEVLKTNIEAQVVREALNEGDWVEEGDIIESEKASFVKVLMNDDTIFSIGSSSKFSFEKFKMKTKNKRTAVYNLMRGKLRSVFTKKAPKKTLTIKTPSAAMGVRGTEIVSDVYKIAGELRTDIALLHGKLEVTTNNGRKFDLSPSDLFEAVDIQKKDIKNAAKVLKGRSIASQNLVAKKRKLESKIFKKLMKKPRKGGEVFLFDALKDKRKKVSKEAEFHNVTEENKVQIRSGKKETERLSIFQDENSFNNKKDKNGNNRDKNKSKLQGHIKKEVNDKSEIELTNKKNLKNSSQDDFDFRPDVLNANKNGEKVTQNKNDSTRRGIKGKSKSLETEKVNIPQVPVKKLQGKNIKGNVDLVIEGKTKEMPRENFYKPNSDRKPASKMPEPIRVKVPDFQVDSLNPRPMKKGQQPKRPKAKRLKGFLKNVKNSKFKRRLRRKNIENIRRGVVNQKLQETSGSRLPSYNNQDNLDAIERQRLLEAEKQRLLEAEKQRLLEAEKLRLIEADQQKLIEYEYQKQLMDTEKTRLLEQQKLYYDTQTIDSQVND